MRWLDRIDARHPILTRAAAILIAFMCLHLAAQIDRANSAAIRWSMAAARAT